jgi:hypothetical protein
MNFFAEDLSFKISLPRTFLFAMSCLVMGGGAVWMTYLARRRGWL